MQVAWLNTDSKTGHETASFESLRKTPDITSHFIFLVSDVHSSAKETTTENESDSCPTKVSIYLPPGFSWKLPKGIYFSWLIKDILLHECYGPKNKAFSNNWVKSPVARICLDSILTSTITGNITGIIPKSIFYLFTKGCNRLILTTVFEIENRRKLLFCTRGRIYFATITYINHEYLFTKQTDGTDSALR